MSIIYIKIEREELEICLKELKKYYEYVLKYPDTSHEPLKTIEREIDRNATNYTSYKRGWTHEKLLERTSL